MGDANPIRTLVDYSKPIHEGYMNTIELPVVNNVVSLRSDTIWLVQNRCSFHGLRSEDPNQHLKDFLKLVDSLDLDGVVKDVEVYIGKLKLLNDFYVIDMKKEPETPLLVGRGFLATANAVIDCRMVKIAVGEGITSSNGVGAQIPYYVRKDFLDCHLPEEWEIAKDAKINPFKDVLVFRRMVEFLGAIPINLKSNIWESKDLINNPINLNKPPKNRDGAWHAKIRLIDLDEEEFTKNPTINPSPHH
nr:zinc finger, CCHC-type [Tanacetum cinerariifolium]